MASFTNALGTLGTTSASVFTPSSGKSAIITSASFCNKIESSTPAVSVTVTSGGTTAYVAYRASVPTNSTFTLKPEVQIILKPGDVLNAWTDQVAAIDFVISATEL